MNLSQWIEHWADFQPDKTAIRFEGKDISYAALYERIRRVAALLRNDLAVKRGDRIAFLGLNSPDMLVLLFACARIGAMLVPMNWRFAPPEHLYILENAGAKILFCEEEFTQGIESIAVAFANCRLVAMNGEYERLVANAGQDALDPDGRPRRPAAARLYVGHHRASEGRGADAARADDQRRQFGRHARYDEPTTSYLPTCPCSTSSG